MKFEMLRRVLATGSLLVLPAAVLLWAFLRRGGFLLISAGGSGLDPAGRRLLLSSDAAESNDVTDCLLLNARAE